MSDEITDLIPLLFALLLLPGVSVPLVSWAADGSVERNAAAGIRTRHTQASDEAWFAGHSAALPVVRKMWPVAAVGLVSAVAVQFLRGGYTGTAVAAGAFIWQIILLLRAARAANRAARSVTTSN